MIHVLLISADDESHTILYILDRDRDAKHQKSLDGINAQHASESFQAHWWLMDQNVHSRI